MDWNGLIENLSGAPRLYWIAAAAIAAGASLLAAASVLHLRRRRPAAPGRSPAPQAAPTARPVPGRYAPGIAAAPQPAATERDLSPLAARLGRLADRLEEMDADLAASSVASEGTFLKETPTHVEYVFRTGEA